MSTNARQTDITSPVNCYLSNSCSYRHRYKWGRTRSVHDHFGTFFIAILVRLCGRFGSLVAISVCGRLVISVNRQHNVITRHS